jgi:hypothetical protein
MKTSDEAWNDLSGDVWAQVNSSHRAAFDAGWNAAMVEVNKLLTEQALKVSPQHAHPHGKSET